MSAQAVAECLYAPAVTGAGAAVCLRQSAGAAPGSKVIDEGYGAFNLGLHVDDDPASVEERRRALGDHCQLTSIRWLNQVHGTACVEQRAQQPASGALVPVPEADAHWTRESGVGLAIMTADCLPVLLWDHQARWVAAAHGGWRGLTAGVLDAALQSLADAGFALRAGTWSSWLGPSICQHHYQVDAPVRDAVRARLPGAADREYQDIVRPCPEEADRWRLSLVGLARSELTKAGSAEVQGGDECVYGAHRFYSHRRASSLRGRRVHEGRGDRATTSHTGRQVSLIWLRPSAG